MTKCKCSSKPVWMCLFCWTQMKIFWRISAVLDHSICFPTMEVNGPRKQPDYKLSSEYLPLCSAEQTHSHRSGTTWGWVNDDWIFIFGWTVPLITNHITALTALNFSLKLCDTQLPFTNAIELNEVCRKLKPTCRLLLWNDILFGLNSQNSSMQKNFLLLDMLKISR